MWLRFFIVSRCVGCVHTSPTCVLSQTVVQSWHNGQQCTMPSRLFSCFRMAFPIQHHIWILSPRDWSSSTICCLSMLLSYCTAWNYPSAHKCAHTAACDGPNGHGHQPHCMADLKLPHVTSHHPAFAIADCAKYFVRSADVRHNRFWLVRDVIRNPVEF